MQSVAILGRQPALGLTELESLFGADSVQRLGDQAALLSIEPETIFFQRLGGTIKLARLITVLDTTDWKKIVQHLVDAAAHHSQHVPAGKLIIGISTYGLSVKPAAINAAALSLKKAIKAAGRPVRVVPNKTVELSSAQVLHNDLTGERGWELVCVRHGSQTYLAQTVQIQDIEAYAARDQARPKRDARVGMLPPKLAQIIINLAVSNIASNDKTILDPFCGTGVILQEALLMGYKTYGTDLETRMIEYAQTNLRWLGANYQLLTTNYYLEVGDATSYTWQAFNTIAAETYLGRPFSALPKPDVLSQVIRDVDTIHKKFLQNVTRQTKAGFRMCIAVPAWKAANGFKHLPTLDNLEQLGYNRLRFVHVDNKELIYHRPNQIVARELVVLQRT